MEIMMNKKDKEKEEAINETKAEFEYQLSQIQDDRERSPVSVEEY